MIDWEKVRYFSKDGDQWSEDPDLYADPSLIYSLDRFRNIIGVPTYPLTAPGSLAKINGSADDPRSVDVVSFKNDRTIIRNKSKAIDVCFEDGSNVCRIWLVAITCGLWTSVGIDFSKPVVSIQLDISPKKIPYTVMWYINRESKRFYIPFDEQSIKILMKILSEF